MNTVTYCWSRNNSKGKDHSYNSNRLRTGAEDAVFYIMRYATTYARLSVQYQPDLFECTVVSFSIQVRVCVWKFRTLGLATPKDSNYK